MDFDIGKDDSKRTLSSDTNGNYIFTQLILTKKLLLDWKASEGVRNFTSINSKPYATTLGLL